MFAPPSVSPPPLLSFTVRPCSELMIVCVCLWVLCTLESQDSISRWVVAFLRVSLCQPEQSMHLWGLFGLIYRYVKSNLMWHQKLWATIFKQHLEPDIHGSNGAQQIMHAQPRAQTIPLMCIISMSVHLQAYLFTSFCMRFISIACLFPHSLGLSVQRMTWHM